MTQKNSSLGQERNDGVGCASMRERSIHSAFLLGPVFCRTALPCSGGYHLEAGRMPLHDGVGINCKKGANIEYQDEHVK